MRVLAVLVLLLVLAVSGFVDPSVPGPVGSVGPSDPGPAVVVGGLGTPNNQFIFSEDLTGDPDVWDQLYPATQDLYSEFNSDPFGGNSAQYWTSGTERVYWYYKGSTITLADHQVISGYFKAVSGGVLGYIRVDQGGVNHRFQFNMSDDGSEPTESSSTLQPDDVYGWEDAGGGWWRVWLYVDAEATSQTGYVPSDIAIASMRSNAGTPRISGVFGLQWDSGTSVLRQYVKTPAEVSAWTTTGPGGGGTLQSIGLGSSMLLGTDTSGIYRSTNGGASWGLLNGGLDYDLAQTRRVYDLTETADGWKAATHGGIFGLSGATWETETPAGTYWWDADEGTRVRRHAIPFSNIAVVGDSLYAGAGDNRWDWDTQRAAEYPNGVDASSHGLYSLWKDGGSGWVPDSGFGDRGHVLDIAEALVGSSETVAVSTDEGCWLKIGAGSWSDIYDAGLTLTATASWWNLSMTDAGYLYGVLAESDTSATEESAVYVMDVSSTTNDWELVSDGDGVVEDFAEGGAAGWGVAAWLAVWPSSGSAADTVLFSFREGGAGHTYRSIVNASSPSTASWDTIYTNTSAVDGWADNALGTGNTMRARPEVLPGGEILAQFSDDDVAVSDDYGDTWESLATDDLGSGWYSGRYGQLCVADVEYARYDIGDIASGSMIFSAADAGMFYTNGTDWSQVAHLDVPYDATRTSTTVNEAWDRGGSEMQVVDGWYNGPALFFIAGEGHWGPGGSNTRLMMYADRDGDSTYEFTTISDAISSDYLYCYTSFEVVSNDTIIAATTVHSGWPTDAARIATQMQRFVYTSGTDTWAGSNPYTGFTTPYWVTDVVKRPGGGTWMSGACNSSIDGGVWRLIGAAWTNTAATVEDVTCLSFSRGGSMLYAGSGSTCDYGTVMKTSDPGSASPTWSVLLNTSTAAFGITYPLLGIDTWTATDLGAAKSITEIGGLAVSPYDSTEVFIGVDNNMGANLAEHVGLWKMTSDGDPERVAGGKVMTVGHVGFAGGRLVVGYRCADVEFIETGRVR